MGTFGSGLYGSGMFGVGGGGVPGGLAEYRPELLSFRRLNGSAMIGVSFVIGESLIGQLEDIATEVRNVSSFVINDGYEIGEARDLTIDPATGAAMFADLIDAPAGARTNLFPADTSFENHADGWTVAYPANTTAGRSTDWGHHGSASYLVSATAIVAGQTGLVKTSADADTTPGLAYTLTFRARVSTGSASASLYVRAELYWKLGGTVVQTDYSATTYVDQDGTVLVTISSIAPLGTDRAGFAVTFFSGHVVGSAVHYDAFLFEQTDEVRSFVVAVAEAEAWVAPELAVGDRVELAYGNTIVFQGYVSEVSAAVEAATSNARDRGRQFERRYTYTLRSITAVMLAHTVSYDALPAEPALARVRRFLTLSTDKLSPAELLALEAINVDAVDEAGSTTLLDQARAFSTATLYTVRVAAGSPANWRSLEVVPASSPDDDAATWASNIKWVASEAGSVMWPTEAGVITNSGRFLSGVDYVYTASAPIGSFIIGAHRIGTAYYVPVGFRPGDCVSIFGQVVTVARISTTYGPKVSAGLELARPAR